MADTKTTEPVVFDPLIFDNYIAASKKLASINISTKLSAWSEIQMQIQGIASRMSGMKPQSKEYAANIKQIQQLGQRYQEHCLASDSDFVAKLVYTQEMFAAKNAGLNVESFRKAILAKAKPAKSAKKK